MGLHERYDAILAALLAALRERYGRRLVSVAVFGSVGRGTQREDSDVDVLVVAHDLPRGRTARVEEYLPVEARLAPLLAAARPGLAPILLSPVFRTPDEVAAGSWLFLDMVEDARILHDPDGFLGGYLSRLRARLRELGSRRVRKGSTWYWVLKPDLQPGERISL